MKPVHLFILLVFSFLDSLCQPLTSQLQTNSPLSSNKIQTPKRLTFQPPPPRLLNSFPSSDSQGYSTKISYTRAITPFHPVTTPKPTEIKRLSLVFPPPPTPPPPFAFTAQTLNVQKQMNQNGMRISGYLQWPLAILDSLNSKAGQRYRYILQSNAANLYALLSQIHKNNGSYADFKYVLAGYVDNLIAVTKDIQNLVRMKARETNQPISVAGVGNSVNWQSSPYRNFISVIGNYNNATGNQIISAGDYLNTNGRNISVYGNTSNVAGVNNIVIGQDKNLRLANKLILGNFYLDLQLYSMGYNYIQYVRPGDNPFAAPYL